jgi:hypothetical protein
MNLFNSFRGTNTDGSSNGVHMKTKFDSSILKPIANVKPKAAVEVKKRPLLKFAEDDSTKF